jgi:hypothetical protein
MKENWILIFKTDNELQAKLAEDVLKQSDIPSHIASKPDSAIPSLGAAELYTLPEYAEKAREVLKEGGFVEAE